MRHDSVITLEANSKVYTLPENVAAKPIVLLVEWSPFFSSHQDKTRQDKNALTADQVTNQAPLAQEPVESSSSPRFAAVGIIADAGVPSRTASIAREDFRAEVVDELFAKSASWAGPSNMRSGRLKGDMAQEEQVSLSGGLM